MRAALVAIGSELLGTDRLDSNSLLVTAVLGRFGVAVERKVVLGDDERAVAAEVGWAVRHFDLVVVGGGLGPTADDVTREAVAAALGRRLERRPEVEQRLVERFASFGMRMPEVNRKQADVIAGAELLDNRWGSAPGQRVDVGRDDGSKCAVFLFPGVPRELERMCAAHLEPWLTEHGDGSEWETWTLKVACLPESTVEERILPAYADFGREAITVLAGVGEIRLRFAARGDAADRRARLEPIARRLRKLVGRAVFAEADGAALEAVVGELLVNRGATVALAESCTGGLVAERLTRVAGSSDYVLGGVVAYANAVKRDWLGVGETVLATQGAVSREVAEALADGARRRFAAIFGVGITGIAGPGGGSDTKPVGTVHLALAGPLPAGYVPPISEATMAVADGAPASEPAGERPRLYGVLVDHRVDGDVLIEHRRVRLPGDRERIRQLASQLALEMLRRRLLALDGDLGALEERW